jgi:hypothetical protein
MGVIPCEFPLMQFCYFYFILVILLFLNFFIFVVIFQGLLDMDRFITEKRKLDDDNESSMAGTSSGSTTHITVRATCKTAERQYNEDNLSFGFISSGEEQPCPK